MEDLRLPVLLMPDDATLLAYNVRGLPISFLIDPEGAVVQRMVGPVTPGRVEAALDPLLDTQNDQDAGR